MAADDAATASWDSVPVLTYHSIDESGSILSTPPKTFRSQMRALASMGYCAVALRDLLDGWDGSRSRSGRPVVLTFDDGFANVADHALPILQELSFSATLFVVADYCGRNNDWPGQPATVVRKPTMTMRQLRNAVDCGFEVGSHTMTHADLTRADAPALKHEIVDSRKMLEDELGAEVSTFAYPCGGISAPAAELVREHYRAGCSTELRYAHRSSPRELLPRLDSYYLSSQLVFRALGTPVGRGYLSLRHLGRLLKASISSR